MPGFIGIYIISPFILFLETDTQMTKAHGIYKTVVTRLREWSDNPPCLLEGGAPHFPGANVHTGVALDSLLKALGEERDKRVCNLLKHWLVNYKMAN